MNLDVLLIPFVLWIAMPAIAFLWGWRRVRDVFDARRRFKLISSFVLGSYYAMLVLTYCAAVVYSRVSAVENPILSHGSCLLVVASPVVAGFVYWQACKCIERTSRSKCPKCGYDLRSNARAGCPECGWKR